jgi:hypothetical protein
VRDADERSFALCAMRYAECLSTQKSNPDSYRDKSQKMKHLSDSEKLPYKKIRDEF